MPAWRRLPSRVASSFHPAGCLSPIFHNRDVRESDPLITAIEVFSPTNKRDPRARAEYVRKRSLYYEADAAVVELGLLRAGLPLIDVPLRTSPRSTGRLLLAAYAGVGRSTGLGLEYYPSSLRRRLPPLRVPLRPGDADIVVDLQPPIDHAYARGRYGTRRDYTRPPARPAAVGLGRRLGRQLRRRRGRIA